MTSESLDVVIQRQSPEKGYDEFSLNNFNGLDTKIDASVLERTSEKLLYVQKFTVGNMF